MSDIPGFDRAQARYDNAEPPEGIEAPDCEECGGATKINREECGCIDWECIDTDTDDEPCGGFGTLSYCRDCAVPE